jgi:hypothetical protein
MIGGPRAGLLATIPAGTEAAKTLTWIGKYPYADAQMSLVRARRAGSAHHPRVSRRRDIFSTRLTA